MKKNAQITIMLLLTTMMLSGCAFGEAPTDFAVRQDDAIAAWTAEGALEREAQPPTSAAETLPTEAEASNEGISLEVEVDVLGIFPLEEREDDATETESETMRRPVSCLEADHKYEVWTRVLIWQDTTDASDNLRTINLGMLCPTVVLATGKAELAALVTPEDGMTVSDEGLSVTTLAYNLSVAYVPDSLTVYQSNRKTAIVLNDAGWGYVPGVDTMQISGAVNLSRQVRAVELTVCYQIETTVLSSQIEEARERAEDPIRIKYLGFVQKTVDDTATTEQALLALQECQKEDYMLPEQAQPGGMVYLVTEVELPEWSRPFINEYGLKLTYFRYLDGKSGEYGISVELENHPRDHGYAEKVIGLAFETDSYRFVTLDSMPATPITLWTDDVEGGFALVAEVKGMTDFSYESATNREEQSRLLIGGNMPEAVAGGQFYLVTAYAVECH